ncbi:MAG: SDR family oxidoreductase [Pseudomonadota bacterium]
MGDANGRKSIFVTGAASGIGAETARHFARKGWFVGLYDIDDVGLRDVAREIGAENCITGLLDVRHRDDWSTALEAFGQSTDGKMNVLFNNAGIARHGWFENVDAEGSDAMIDINVKGVVNGVYAALPLLKTTDGARIVNVASTAGFVGSPQLAVYSATKFAVRGLTEALNVEFAPLDIKVTCLAPWFVDTPILNAGDHEGSNHKMSDQLKETGMAVYSVEMAGQGAWDAAHGSKTHYGVGAMSNRARFISRFLPGLMRRNILKNMPERT